LELFAWMAENLGYRANQVPERNRRKFLSLLGLPLAPASSAQGIVTLANEKGPLETITVDRGIEVRAGSVPFRTEQGLDILPVEGRVYFKRTLPQQPDELRRYYEQLYASYTGPKPLGDPASFQLYETVALEAQGSVGVDLAETADGSAWVALLVREG